MKLTLAIITLAVVALLAAPLSASLQCDSQEPSGPAIGGVIRIGGCP